MSENAGTPEYIRSFKVHIFHSMEVGKYEAQVSDVGTFSDFSLPVALANSLQGMLYVLFEEQRRQEMMQPGRPL